MASSQPSSHFVLQLDKKICNLDYRCLIYINLMNQSSGSSAKASASAVVDLRSNASEVSDDSEDPNEAGSATEPNEAGSTNATLLSKTENGLRFVVYGKPVALERARMSRHGHMYNPSKPAQDMFKQRISSFVHAKVLLGPLRIRLVFYFNRPKHHYGSGRNSQVLRANADHWHTKKGDIDNLAKFVLDAMNKSVYQDDKQVAELSVAKICTDGRARVEVEVEKLFFN